MNEQMPRFSFQKESAQITDLHEPTIRSQLLWASLFPLVLFGLLSILTIETILNRTTLKLALERNTVQIQALAYTLSNQRNSQTSISSLDLTQVFETVEAPRNGQLFLIDMQRNLLASSNKNLTQPPISYSDLLLFLQNSSPMSEILESSESQESIMVSSTVVPDSGGNTLILIEPLSDILTPVRYYQAVIIGLLFLGTTLSLVMLSVSVHRITSPITNLAENASEAVPGSIFHPILVHGPREIRALINAFNKMVIRLAEQQTMLRQYANKALLSQEEERQRLSHELHDGTMQDLVGLTQRVELCRTELDRNPELARQRLDELQQLLGQTLADVRRISYALRPPILEDFGLSIAVDALCKDLLKERPNILCEFLIVGKERRLQADLELAVYRVIQESIKNIQKHAPTATTAHVTLTYTEDEIYAEIKNNGKVFINQGVNSFVKSGHLGLAGMYERAQLYGGTLTINSSPDLDTTVLLIMPCPHNAGLEA